MNKKYWIPLLLGVVLIGTLSFGWYMLKNESRSSALQNVSKGVPVLENQSRQAGKGATNVENANTSADRDSAGVAVPALDEESLEKAQSVSDDTSLDAIDKELNQTDLGE